VTKPDGMHRDVLDPEDRKELLELCRSCSLYSDVRGLLSGYLSEALDALTTAERERDEAQAHYARVREWGEGLIREMQELRKELDDLRIVALERGE
jgi:hypothetical protein